MQEEPRWPVPVGLGIVGLVVLANAASDVGLGTSGDALVVTVSVAVFCVAAVVFLLWLDAPPRATIALLAWEPERVSLVVESQGGRSVDRGKDAELAASGSGYGLTGLTERARLLGGDVDAGPTAAGFRVALRLPLTGAPAGREGAG